MPATAHVSRKTAAQVLSFLLLATALSLSLPGIRAVQAEEPDMTPVTDADYEEHLVPAAPVAEAQACDDPAPRAAGQRARNPLLAGAPTPKPGEPGVEVAPGVVVLNNRGYNYGAVNGPNDAQWQRLQREMAESAAAAAPEAP